MAKVMVSMPDDLLATLDREAARRATTRSAMIQGAVSRELGRPDPEALDAAIASARSLFADAGPFESADLVRAERRRHDR